MSIITREWPRRAHPYRTGRGSLHPPSFKAANQPHVLGGRWSVRKLLNGKWSAWSKGRSARWRATFSSHQAAFGYAQEIAAIYSRNPPSSDAIDFSCWIAKEKWREFDKTLTK